MNTTVITLSVIIIAFISVLLIVLITCILDKMDRITSRIEKYLNNIYEKETETNVNILTSTKEIHTHLKSIIELNNGIKEDNKELVENYQKICDDLATIITTINEKKTTRRIKRLDDGCGKHKCKCHEENNSQQISKEDTSSKIDFEQEANR